MATNDFLPFAGGAGANVLDQAVYAALPALASGFKSGILPSDNLNKVLRQASIMAAVLGQFIADNAAQNVVDDGTTGTIEASLVTAIAALRTAAFTGSNQSLGSSGYQKFPGGLILQWGTANSTTLTTGTLTLPISFPNQFLVAFSSDNKNNTADYGQVGVTPVGLNQITWYSVDAHAGAPIAPFNWAWWAIGN